MVFTVCFFRKNAFFMKQRLDVLLLERGLADSREQAQRLIMAGSVYVAGQTNVKAGHRVSDSIEISVAQKERYVSRGGLKLERALSDFSVSVDSKICADIGTSTGGFTDCLLQHGAERVFCVDVGKSQIHERLRGNEQVVLVEETNARFLTDATLPVRPELMVIDVSFISLTKIFAGVRNLCSDVTQIATLIKPQFEASPKDVSRGKGIVTDPLLHCAILLNVLRSAAAHGLFAQDLVSCALPGTNGNHEWFALLSLRANTGGEDNLQQHIVALVKNACAARWNDVDFSEQLISDRSERNK